MQVIHLLLQMLVENAIISIILYPAKNRLQLSSARRGFYCGEKQPADKTSGVEFTGMGLRNIANRYELLTNKQVECGRYNRFQRYHFPYLHLVNYESTDY